MILNFLKAYLFSKRANAHIKKMAWISLGGITLGTFSLIVVLSVMSGLNKSTEERLLKHEPHLIVEDAGIDFQEAVQKAPGLLSFNVFEMQDVLIKTAEGFFTGSEAVGIEESSLKTKKSFYNYDEEPLVYDLEDFVSGEGLFIGSDLAFELKIVVGDNIELYKPEAIIKGQLDLDLKDSKTVLIAGVLNSESGDREGRLLIYKHGGLFKGKSLSLTSGYEVYVKNPQKVKITQTFLSKLGYKVQTWRERNSSLFLALKLEKLAMTFLLGLALLITSFSIMTLLILVVVQKQKDIGILLSMGFSKTKIRGLFAGIGAGVSLCGIFIGGFLGVLVSALLDAFPVKILPPIYQDPYLPADFNLNTVAWVLFFCIIVALLSSVIPILYLSKVTPVSALKETSQL